MASAFHPYRRPTSENLSRQSSTRATLQRMGETDNEPLYPGTTSTTTVHAIPRRLQKKYCPPGHKSRHSSAKPSTTTLGITGRELTNESAIHDTDDVNQQNCSRPAEDASSTGFSSRREPPAAATSTQTVAVQNTTNFVYLNPQPLATTAPTNATPTSLRFTHGSTINTSSPPRLTPATNGLPRQLVPNLQCVHSAASIPGSQAKFNIIVCFSALP